MSKSSAATIADPLDQALPATLEKVVQRNLVVSEMVLIRLKGAFKEALVCTDRRVMIVKSGSPAGHPNVAPPLAATRASEFSGCHVLGATHDWRGAG